MNKATVLKNIYAVKNLDSLNPGELFSFIQLLRNIQSSPGGPYGIGHVNGSELLGLNIHIKKLFANQGKDLPQIDKFLINSKKAKDIDGLNNNTNNSSPNPLPAPIPLAIQQTVYQQFDDWLSDLPTNIRKTINTILIPTKNIDRAGEITLLNYHFITAASQNTQQNVQQSLRQNFQQSLQQNNYVNLGLANLLAWVGYGLIDNLIDEPHKYSADQLLIPAQLCLSQASQIYNSYAPGLQIAPRLFCEVNLAINQELQLRAAFAESLKAMPNQALLNRLLTKTKALLSAKSIAHGIGPLLFTEQFLPDATHPVEIGLRAYCAARQLNDDLHDWTEDYINGQPTYSLMRIIKDHAQASLPSLVITPSLTNTPDSSNLTNTPNPPGTVQNHFDLNDLKTTFWHESLSSLLQTQQRFVHKSRSSLLKVLNPSVAADFFSITVDPIENTLDRAKKSINYEHDFLNYFRLSKGK